MLGLDESGQEIDLRTLQARLEDLGELERVGGLAFLAGLDLDLPDLARAETYAGIVRDRALRRRLIRDCHEIASRCYEGRDGSAKAVLDEAYGRRPPGRKTIERWLDLCGGSEEVVVASLERLGRG